MKLVAAIVLVLVAGAAARASDVRAVRSLSSAEGQSGTVAIICPAEIPGMRRVSRGFAIDLGAHASYDIVIAVRHASAGFDAGDITACRVRAPGGRYLPVADFRNAGLYRDEGDDWIAIRTPRRLPERLRRLPLARFRDERQRLPEIAVLAGRPRSGCSVLAGTRLYLGQGHLFAHDCATRPGLSGAPVVIILDGRMTVIGFHVGQLMTVGGMDTERHGVGRWIDAAIERAVVDLMATAD